MIGTFYLLSSRHIFVFFSRSFRFITQTLSVREAVLREMSEMTGNAEVDGAANAASAGNPPQYTGRKGSLLTTLSDIVHESIENSGGHAEPGVLSKRQEISAYLSEPVLPVRSPDGKANLEELRGYWYHHKNEWSALTRLALSYLSESFLWRGTLLQKNGAPFCQGTSVNLPSSSSIIKSFNHIDLATASCLAQPQRQYRASCIIRNVQPHTQRPWVRGCEVLKSKTKIVLVLPL